jgi:hypothetical protein
MPLTLNELNTGTITGVRESPVIDLSTIKRIKTAVINFTVDTPTDTAIVVETNVALDGVTWIGWKAVTNGAAIPDLPLGVVVKTAKLKIRHTLTTTSLNLPYVLTTTLSFTPAYLDAEWVSKEFVLEDMNVLSSNVVMTETLNSGTVNLFTRSRLKDGVWTAWQAQTDGAALVTKNSSIQFKIELKPNATMTTTPSVASLITNVVPEEKMGIWTSNIVDVSQAVDKATGKISIDSSIIDGKVVIYSRSRAGSTGDFSAWFVALADGTLMHPANSFVQIMLVLTGSNVTIKDITMVMDGAAQTTLIGSELTPGAQYKFTTLRDKLIIANGKDPIKKWDGITATIEDIPLVGNPPVLTTITTHHNRVWGVDAENKSRVRYSNILDPETWGAFDFIDFNPEDGDYITALLRYGQNLVVSKQRSQALLTGNKASNYNVSWLDSEAGVSGINAICHADKYVTYVSQDGIRFTDLANSVVATERMLPDWGEINHRRLNQACMVHWKNHLYVALPSKDSLENDTVWSYDFLRNAWAIYKGWNVSQWLKFHQYGEDILLAADSRTGQIYEVFISEYDDEVPVEYKWRSKDFNFKYPERYKLFRNIFLDIEGVTEASTLDVVLYVDGIEVGTYTAEIPAGEGVKHTRRILPPLYGAVLGRMLTIELRGRCGVQGVAIEYVVRGAVPGEDL